MARGLPREAVGSAIGAEGGCGHGQQQHWGVFHPALVASRQTGKRLVPPGGTAGLSGIFLLVTLFGEGSGCPYESGGGSAILTGSALIPRGHPQGGRHAGRRALVPARSGPEDDLHSLLAGAV